MTDEQIDIIRTMDHSVQFIPRSWDKKFLKSLAERRVYVPDLSLSEKQNAMLMRTLFKYRAQVPDLYEKYRADQLCGPSDAEKEKVKEQCKLIQLLNSSLPFDKIEDYRTYRSTGLCILIMRKVDLIKALANDLPSIPLPQWKERELYHAIVAFRLFIPNIFEEYKQHHYIQEQINPGK